LIVKVNPFDVPPPGVGLTTVTDAFPAVAMLLAATEAVNFVPLTYVVVSPVPFHCIVEVETKFVPVTVKVNAAPPAVALEGESLLSVGTGLTPVPFKLTVCGLLGAMSVKISEAVRIPVADGVNFTLTLQAPLAINLAPVQVSAVLAKSLEFAPLIVTDRMARGLAPVLVRLTLCAALVVSTI
jgi:hypothetical protein